MLDGDILGENIKDAVEALSPSEKADILIAWQTIAGEITDHISSETGPPPYFRMQLSANISIPSGVWTTVQTLWETDTGGGEDTGGDPGNNVSSIGFTNPITGVWDISANAHFLDLEPGAFFGIRLLFGGTFASSNTNTANILADYSIRTLSVPLFINTGTIMRIQVIHSGVGLKNIQGGTISIIGSGVSMVGKFLG